MTDLYVKEILRVAVAQICQTIGYHATQSAPLELLQDVLDKFLKEFTRDLRRQVDHYNRTEANMDDMTLTLNSINVNVSELLDYVNNVEPVPFAMEVPKFPARKNSYLNFLKPGSKEVLTRPVHVHDHLPPMLPPENTQTPDSTLPSTSNGLSDIKPATDNNAGSSTGDQPNGNDGSSGTPASSVLDKNTLQSLFKTNSNLDDADRPTREVSSVVMTTGGYISPAVEGKMPEAIVPDIIDKLLGLDAPPPPPPPPPPPAPAPAPISRPASRSATSTPAPMGDLTSTVDDLDNDKSVMIPPVIKESKKSLANKIADSFIATKKSDAITEFSDKKKKLSNLVPNASLDASKSAKLNKKKQLALLQHNAAGHSNQTNFANMLLKKAKKQKPPLAPGQTSVEKNVAEKPGKLDPAEKTQRKYVKILQKMAKQGKIPSELLNIIMGSDKKSKILNPAIITSLPPGPEKVQLEKLLKKHIKQRQRQFKQQMMQDLKKSKKNQVLPPPPLVPFFAPIPSKDNLSNPLTIDLDESKQKIEQKDMSTISPMKAALTPNLVPSPGRQPQISDAFMSKNMKAPVITETLVAGDALTPVQPVLSGDGKNLKLSNEPDRSKLNIFKKISKQKTPKSSSPTPLRLPGMGDTPIINLPSGTTITPAPGPGGPPVSAVGRTLFPPLSENASSQIINLDDIKDNPPEMSISSNPPQTTDMATLNRVFGEKPPGGESIELVNKPKKRGRKPGSKNSPKIPGVIPASMLKKNKKMKMDPKLFASHMPQMPIPPEFAAATATGNINFDNVEQLFGNPMEWAQNKLLHQQMLIMAAAKERKEQKKKNKINKQDLLLPNEKNPMMPTNLSMGMGVPTSEEVQNLNKKLMRMDTILKTAPSASANDLSVDTSLITGKKLPSPSLFPPSMTSPLKSPGVAAASKRIMQNMENVAAAGLGQPFMLPNRPAFPNLPTNMLSMLAFPFNPRPGLIPTPGLFPTPGLGAFQTNAKNPLLPGMFPYPNLKQTSTSDPGNSETEDLSIGKKKTESMERSYCNVAPLVPEFLKANTPETMKLPDHQSESDLPKTPKPRSSHSSTPQENLPKKIAEAQTPESTSGSTKSIPLTPGGMSINTFEQLMKKNDSPIELVPLNKTMKGLHTPSQETGLDFSMNKKHTTPPGLSMKPPITLNNEPIEVSDDSDEPMSQPPPPPPKPQPVPPALAPISTVPPSVQPNFNMDEMFLPNAGAGKPPATFESDLSSKELKKLKKQVKKTSSTSLSSSLINPEKSDGVSKLAGGADLIPLTSTGLAYSSKNIPFNSLTANANPTFNPHKTDFNPPSTSVFDNVTITAAIPSTTSSSSTNVFDLQKKRKEHKKLKKLKELKDGKIKKKKDKKDKSKSKEKAEKYLLTQQTSPSKDKGVSTEIPTAVSSSSGVVVPSGGMEKCREKDLIKKLKKEKKKEKQRSSAEDTTAIISSTTPFNITAPKEQTPTPIEVEKKQKSSPLSINSSSGNEPVSAPISTTIANPTVVPKLTLKLGSTQSPTPIDDLHKNTNTTTVAASAAVSPPRETHREPSPELARISPLVTRPPKHKVNPSDLASSSSAANSIASTNVGAGSMESFGDINKNSSTTNVSMIVPPPSPWLSGGTISASSVLLPHQLLQTTKHDTLVAPSTGSGQSSTDNPKSHHTAVDRQSPLTLITETSRPSSYIDAEGNRVWICPACGKVDDGSPMIGCDGCDAWYHWVCVGIFVAPKDNEDWFCRVCITRKKGLHGSDKKRKRNKKK